MTPRHGKSASSERWGDPQGDSLGAAVLERLRTGAPLDDLPIGRHNGRWDLRGLAIPSPARSSHASGGWSWTELQGALQWRNVSLRDLDLSGAVLDHLRFFDAEMHNCLLEGASCRDWKLWGATVTDSSFVRAGLGKAVLGAWYNERGDVYRRVTFARADLRGAILSDSSFEDCDFSHARIEKTVFGSSALVRCQFAGDVREVQFYARDQNGNRPDPNPMEDVDFSAATLHDVEFRGLDLDRVRLPQSPEHLVIRNYRCVLLSMLAELENDGSAFARGTRAALNNRLHWAGPQQQVGVLNAADIVEEGDQDSAERLILLLRRAEKRCGSGLSTG